VTIAVLPQLADNYAYALATRQGHVAVVDPAQAPSITAYCRQHHLALREIWATHHHADHTGGVAELLTQWPEAVLRIHEIDWRVLATRDAACARLLENAPNRLVVATHGLQFAFGAWNVEVIFNPGHTLGAVSYLAHAADVAPTQAHGHAQPGALFTGDTLFGAGCGRRFEGTADVFHASLVALAELPPETRVYFGHEYTANNLRFASTVEPSNAAIATRLARAQAARAQAHTTTPSTIELERQTNPFLRCHLAGVSDAVAAHVGAPLTTPPAVFAALRAWKDRFV